MPLLELVTLCIKCWGRSGAEIQIWLWTYGFQHTL